MPCIALPEIPLPPGLDLLLPSLPDIDVSPPGIGLALCCELPIPPLPIPPLPLSSIPGVAVILQPAMAGIHSYIDQINSLLRSIQVTCPNE